MKVAAARPCVEHIMGTAIVIDVRDDGAAEGRFDAAIEAAFAHFRAVDERFSTYKGESEVCRLNRGEIAPDELSGPLAEVLELCEQARQQSDGYFDIRGHRRDGAIDPSGLVKGWSVEGAAGILDAAGARNYTINAAGDLITRGESEPGRGWPIGIANPWDPKSVVAVVQAAGLAVATSGAYERGEHVINPHTGHAPQGIASMTVVGPSLTWADAWATAGFAMGVRGVDWVARELDGYGACAVSADRHLIMSAGFERLLLPVLLPG